MDYGMLPLVFAVVLLLGMLLMLDVGRRIGIRRQARDTEGARAGLGAVEGAIFALLGLLIAFTFSGAAARFDARRQLVVEESNAIGTAYLRVDLLPAGVQPPLRARFRQYVDSRLAVYARLPDVEAAKEELARSGEVQLTLWREAVAACRQSDSAPATMLLLPAMNQMIDITTTRTMAAQMHPPAVIFALLGALALAGALLAGYGMAGGKTRSWIHIVAFAAIMALTVFVILDIEYPRLGLIRVDAFDQALIDLRQGMN